MKRTEDRRLPDRDRRKTHCLEYFENGGVERRDYVERRKTGEMRTDWARISEWSSMYVG